MSLCRSFLCTSRSCKQRFGFFVACSDLLGISIPRLEKIVVQRISAGKYWVWNPNTWATLQYFAKLDFEKDKLLLLCTSPLEMELVYSILFWGAMPWSVWVYCLIMFSYLSFVFLWPIGFSRWLKSNNLPKKESVHPFPIKTHRSKLFHVILLVTGISGILGGAAPQTSLIVCDVQFQWLWVGGSRIAKLVGGFNPFEKYSSNWKSSPNRGENKNIFETTTQKTCCHDLRHTSSLHRPPFFATWLRRIRLVLRLPGMPRPREELRRQNSSKSWLGQ